MSKIEIIGSGTVVSALASGLAAASYEVRTVGHDERAIRNAADWCDVAVWAVPFGALEDVVKSSGAHLEGKTVVDVTNALDSNMNLAVGFTTSGAEIQRVDEAVEHQDPCEPEAFTQRML